MDPNPIPQPYPPNYQPVQQTYQSVPQMVQQASQSSYYTKETDDLLKKYLKIQINMFYWNIVGRIFFIIFIVVTTYLSLTQMVPFIEKMMGSIAPYQQLLQGKTNLPTNINNGGQDIDINAILEQLNGK